MVWGGFMKATVLVAGGAGFAGSGFIKYMLKKYPEYSLINLDALNRHANIENLDEIQGNQNYSFIRCDISDIAFVEQVFSSRNIDFIVNFAVEEFVEKGSGSLEKFTNANVLGTKALLDACLKYSAKRFVQISSDSVYGNQACQTGYTEDSPFNPCREFPMSKAMADMLTAIYHKTCGFPVNVVRFPNIYGSYQFPEKLVPLIVVNALEMKELPVYGDGLVLRDWVYVEDACRAVDLVMHYGEPGEAYNISGDDRKNNIEIVKYIAKEVKADEALIRFLKEKAGSEPVRLLNSQKIRDELGWKPSSSLEEGLKSTIRWYRDNSDWWKRIKSGEYLKANKNVQP